MASSKRPKRPPKDPDALSTLVDKSPPPGFDAGNAEEPLPDDVKTLAMLNPLVQPGGPDEAPTHQVRRPVLAPDFTDAIPKSVSDDWEEADTTPNSASRERVDPQGMPRRFDEPPTDQQALGSLDDWVDDWPPADPFGEADTVARKRVAPTASEPPLAKAKTKERAVDPPPTPLAPLATPITPASGDAEATIKVPSRPPAEIRNLREGRADRTAERETSKPPVPTRRISPPPRHRDVDPEQALGFMTVGLVFGLALSAFVVSVVAGWLATSG